MRLNEQGTIGIFEDVISGCKFKRPGLNALIDYTRSGDIVCVVRLDRLGRSLKELLETVETLKQTQINFMSLEEKRKLSSCSYSFIISLLLIAAI